MKVSYMSIIESSESSKGPSAMFLLQGQIKLKSMFKLVSLSYRTAYIHKLDKIEIQCNL